ncbi:MAG TPA: sensor histidine kinase [Candidatus Limnocylindrales bacterium]|nr:sensor histidine kinase [Candidatus Limnocylindrales bacterium]
MEPARQGSDSRDSRFDGLQAEASAAVGYSANMLKGIRERYHQTYVEALGEWQALRDDLTAADREPRDVRARTVADGATDTEAANAAEAGAGDARRRTLRGDVDQLTADLALHQAELAKLELAERTLERTWLFLERGDASLVGEVAVPATTSDLKMRIMEAQEAERSRLGQEIHDGPAQALANAIFQVEYIERVLDTDVPLAHSELGLLRELLRRELGDVRAFITQLRPATVDELGLDEAIKEAVDHVKALAGMTATVDLTGPAGALSSGQRTVVLRIAQEALQNVRKHAGAGNVTVTTRQENGAWVLEVRDDGRGFDVGAVAARGRRNFGLQFMRERAELIGAELDVRSRPEGGTVVRLAIQTGPPAGSPAGSGTGAEESR